MSEMSFRVQSLEVEQRGCQYLSPLPPFSTGKSSIWLFNENIHHRSRIFEQTGETNFKQMYVTDLALVVPVCSLNQVTV